MLNEPIVLKDFVWRVLWLGWTNKAQFEDYWMSLFGVLGSTPTGPDELRLAASSDNQVFNFLKFVYFKCVYQQLQASSIAVEALTNLLINTLLYPEPGNSVNGYYLIKSRNRRENFLFLNSL